MSPEQAAGRLDQLGPASDVYSLGATLFCLLTGQPPFADKDVGSILQKVQRGEFPRPRDIKANVPTALEMICRKAMALNPADRYATPRLLADDIEHWLADEPVSAWREPVTVTARRWMGRHRPLVAGAAATVIVALVALIVATVLLTAANERERQAKLKAEQNFKIARDAVDRYFTQVSTEVLLNEPGMQPLQKKLLGSAQEFYEKFIKERGDDPSLQGELGKATYRLAQITGEIDSELKAIDLHEQAVKRFEKLTAQQNNADFQSDLAACHYQLGRLYRLTDQLDNSKKNYEKSHKLWEGLWKEHPKERQYLAGLARAQLGLGNYYWVIRRNDDALKYYREALENFDRLRKSDDKMIEAQRNWAVLEHNLGRIYRDRDMKGEAEAAFEEARKVQQKLVDSAPNVTAYQNDLARTELNQGKYAAAAERWQDIIKLHPAMTQPHATLAVAYTALAGEQYKAKNFAKAEEMCAKAVKMQRDLVASHQGVSSYQGDLSRFLLLLGEAHMFAEKLDKAQETLDEALGIQTKLVREAPQVPYYQSALARVHQSLGHVHTKKKQPEKASAEYKRAAEVWQKLLNEYPDQAEFKKGLKDAQRLQERK
jgi:serine/threonine-protein kinase